MICIDCNQPIYINVTKKTRGCSVCEWETPHYSVEYLGVD